MIIAEFVGRDPEGFHALVELAETLGAPVYDVNARLNFPSRHPLNLSMVKDVFRDADLVLCLDTRDWERATTELVSTTREVTSVVPPAAKWIDIGFGDLEISSWAMDYQRLAHADLRILADTTLAIPALDRAAQGQSGQEHGRRDGAGRRTALGREGAQQSGKNEAKRGLGREPDHAAAPRDRGVERDQGRGLGPDRQYAGGVDAQALGLRQAVPPSGQVARHRDADRHLARRGARAPRRRSAWSWTCSPTAT